MEMEMKPKPCTLDHLLGPCTKYFKAFLPFYPFFTGPLMFLFHILSSIFILPGKAAE